MSDDVIYRREAIDEIRREFEIPGRVNGKTMLGFYVGLVKDRLERLPAARLERDIPIKPKETTDRTWGIPARQAVCPKCDSYLSNVVFVGDGKCVTKCVTYCENCGQAIDWEGWDVCG